ncbi:hypothetical protein [Collinsella sp. An268]|uniref:hypothetical protein n=1 Tax=Collinsella sp. An268 TaxID=1965612 RepID=UPI000B39DD1F|nr:hypothetical protein [Collinsella sp. An268]OUO63131.1 hypothetical protein B5F70_10220 [Collinsella sp. An268]
MVAANLFGNIHIEEEVRKRVLARIRQTSRIAAVICAIGAVFCFLRVLLPIVGMAQALLASSDALLDGATEGNRVVLIASPAIEIWDTNGLLVGALHIPDSLEALLATAGLMVAALLFIEVSRSGRPFENKSARRLRLIGVVCLLTAIVPPVVGGLYITLKYGQFDLGLLMVEGAIPRAQNLAIGVLGILILAFAPIIAYGQILQQQDDTLL